MDHGGLKSQHHFRKIIKMCIIFVLAGIFNETTKAIGSVDSFVNFALSNIPNTFLVAHVAEINGTKKLAIMDQICLQLHARATVVPLLVTYKRQEICKSCN